jgi:hypothetical protein
MARYCGTCGSSLGPGALYSGQCPTCGSRIDASNHVQDPRDIASADNPTQEALGYVAPPEQRPARLWDAESPKQRNVKRRSKGKRKRERIPALWVFTLLLAVALLLAGAGILALSQNRGLSFFTPSNANANINSSTSGTSTATGAANSSTSGAGPTSGTGPGGATATLAPGQPTPSPRPGSSPTSSGATPAPTSTPVPTAVPVPPVLSVSPTSLPPSLVCLGPIGGQASFIVANTGGGQMSWSASAGGYSVSPGNGTLGAGGQQTVTVTWHQNGAVTITAPGSTNSPQQVSFSCTL